MACNHARSTAKQQPQTGMDSLEHSIVACEELLASMEAAKYPSAGRARYLLGVKLANMRRQLKDDGEGEAVTRESSEADDGMESMQTMEWDKDTAHTPASCRSIENVQQAGAEIIINVGEDLDLRQSDTFLHAVGRAQRDVTSRIVVDLRKTRRIFDSGLALLMLLNDRTWRLSSKIRIINCPPELKYRLSCGLQPGLFNLVQGCQE